ncbi:MAG: hypothetical protein QHD01_31580 [Bradyrhizobium sp.]|uniref:hypothetical protein n=1 Tax=Bradyrhizobium sp. TaxID=376 RepID=UPI0029B6E498|nr:hypothetical protein [Bradyrhizobium sp.]MDX3971111.1 hypothetical protein [Bradyrhizobium sp.]
MAQFELAFDVRVASIAPPSDRRIDITIERLRLSFEELSDSERAALVCKPWWVCVDTVLALRAMERGEEEVTGRYAHGVADIYDRLVEPGQPILEALIRVHNDIFTPGDRA